MNSTTLTADKEAFHTSLKCFGVYENRGCTSFINGRLLTFFYLNNKARKMTYMAL